MCGLAADELVGHTPRALLRGTRTDPTVTDRIRAAIKAGQDFHEELLNYRKDGTPYWVSSTPVQF